MFAVFRAVAIDPHFGQRIGFEAEKLSGLFGIEKNWFFARGLIVDHDDILLFQLMGMNIQEKIEGDQR